MSISFNSIPAELNEYFVAAEIDPSNANQSTALLTYSSLIIGQRLTTGSAAAGEVHRVTDVDDVIALAGRGSMLHQQAIAWFAQNTETEVSIGVLDDNAAGASAAGTITVTGPATASGTISLYLGGVRVAVGVTSGDTADDIAAAIEAAIDAELDLPITSSSATNVVTNTYRHKGLVGNDFDSRDSYAFGESLPAGVSLVYVQLTGGTSNPVLTTLLDNLGDDWYHTWTHPYTDATSLTAIEGELSDRFGPTRMIDGLAFTSAAGTLATLVTLGNSRNSPHSVICSQPGKNPLTPPCQFAAGVAAEVSKQFPRDPARPVHTLQIKIAKQITEPTDKFTYEERSSLVTDGIATSRNGGGGVVQIGRLATTFQLADSGAPSRVYRDANTMATLLYLRYSWRVHIQSKYPRHKLADDGTQYGPGQAIITPAVGKIEAIGWFGDMQELGLVENLQLFKDNLISERNATDPNRLDIRLTPDLINQLIAVGTQIGFRL